MERNGKWGYVYTTGKSAISFRYEWAGSFSDGLAPTKINGKFGFINKSGKTVIPYIYEAASEFSDGLSDVIKDGCPGCINIDGRWFESRKDAIRSFSSYARPIIEKDVNEWQKKGEFEKTDDWMSRVNEVTRKSRIDSLISEMKQSYVKTVGESIKSKKEITDYDADGEIYMIKDSAFGNIFVPVPVADAPFFKENFANASIIDKYCVSSDTLALAESEFRFPDGRKYYYRNDAGIEFSAVNVEYSFDAIDLSGANDSFDNKSTIRTKNILLGQSVYRAREVDTENNF